MNKLIQSKSVHRKNMNKNVNTNLYVILFIKKHEYTIFYSWTHIFFFCSAIHEHTWINLSKNIADLYILTSIEPKQLRFHKYTKTWSISWIYHSLFKKYKSESWFHEYTMILHIKKKNNTPWSHEYAMISSTKENTPWF